MTQKVILMILDGWGFAPNPEVSAVDLAQTPNIDALYEKHSHSSLLTHGENVGLPDGQMGNSEGGAYESGCGKNCLSRLG
jgi:2,3-bisphosphoglycerate-independent phosphoglycerate mutase